MQFYDTISNQIQYTIVSYHFIQNDISYDYTQYRIISSDIILYYIFNTALYNNYDTECFCI